MSGRTPKEAWTNYVHPLREALRCITPGRFVLRQSQAGLQPNVAYSVSLNNMTSVPLRGPNNLALVAGQTIRIHDWQSTSASERYSVQMSSYAHAFAIATDHRDQELLMFHWNHREQSQSSLIPAGHLHVGSILLARPTVIRPDDFHNAHIPTGPISFPALVRFAIVELGVTPLVADWESVLAHCDQIP